MAALCERESIERARGYARVLERARALGPLKRLGLSQRIQWTPSHEELLGQATDKDLAKEWQADNTAIWWKRRILNRLPYRPTGGRMVVWDARMIRDLGSITDGEVARKYSISPRSVMLERTRRGIAPCYQRRNCLRLTKRQQNRLGKEDDALLAREWGWNEGTVGEARRRLGIPSKTKWRVDWNDPTIRGRIGLVSDRSLARELGLAYPSVRKQRVRLGIPAYKPPPGRRRRRKAQ